jgi:hypothetical protein
MFQRRLLWCSPAVAGALFFGVLASRGQETARTNDSQFSRQESDVVYFLEAVSDGDVDEAYRALLEGSQIAAGQEAVVDLKQKTLLLGENYGQFEGIERIESRPVGQSLAMLTYLYKCRRYPVVWRFTYYRPNQGSTYRLIAVRFDTNLDALVSPPKS